MHLGYGASPRYMTGDSVFDTVARGRAMSGESGGGTRPHSAFRGRVNTGDSVASEASTSSFFSTDRSISTVEIVPDRPPERATPVPSRLKKRRHSLQNP